MKTTRTGLPTFETIIEQLAQQNGSNGATSTSPSPTNRPVVTIEESDTFQFNSLPNASVHQSWDIDTSSFQLVPRFAELGIDKAWFMDWLGHDADAVPVSRQFSNALHKEMEQFPISSHLRADDTADVLAKAAVSAVSTYGTELELRFKEDFGLVVVTKERR